MNEYEFINQGKYNHNYISIHSKNGNSIAIGCIEWLIFNK
jgi:hypothetical protein